MPKSSKGRKYRQKYSVYDIFDTVQMVGQGMKAFSDYSTMGMNRKRGTTGFVNMESGGKMGAYIKAHKWVSDKRSLQRVQETPGVLQDYNCCYVGHSTLPCTFALETACFGLARLMMSKLGTSPTSVDTAELTLDGTLTIRYRDTPTLGQTSTTVATYASAVTSVAGMGASIMATIITAATAQASVIFDALYFTPQLDGGAVNMSSIIQTINLMDAQISIGCVSNLKIQNATRHETAAGIDSELTDVVDAMPLIGKIYSGPGQGAWPKLTNTIAGLPLLSDPYYGNIYNVAGAIIGFQEPVNPNILENVKKVSGVKFEPGQIHTSRLVDGFKGTVQKYLRILTPLISKTFYATYAHGKYAVVGVEKAIGLKSAVPSDYTPVRVHYEINQEWNVYVQDKKQNQMLQTYAKANNFTLGP